MGVSGVPSGRCVAVPVAAVGRAPKSAGRNPSVGDIAKPSFCCGANTPNGWHMQRQVRSCLSACVCAHKTPREHPRHCIQQHERTCRGRRRRSCAASGLWPRGRLGMPFSLISCVLIPMHMCEVSRSVSTKLFGQVPSDSISRTSRMSVHSLVSDSGCRQASTQERTAGLSLLCRVRRLGRRSRR